MGIPHVIVPGCIDMVNFGGPDSIPTRFKDRLFYEWNPSVTLMRTSPEENYALGKIFAQKANAATGPVSFLIPKGGFSILDSIDEDGKPQLFWDPAADQAFCDGLQEQLNADIPLHVVDVAINHPQFSARAVSQLLELQQSQLQTG